MWFWGLDESERRSMAMTPLRRKNLKPGHTATHPVLQRKARRRAH